MLKSLLILTLSRSNLIIGILLVFLATGLNAVHHLNVEAYPDPAPVILEITAQAPGLSAEEMERYYTTPMEIGLYSTPGIANIRSTSFYGLSFVRVTFRYGIDYYFAYTQAALALQQNVSLPNNQVAQIQQSSLTGEIYRYQVVGPPHFGLSNLRTVQDWVVARRLSTITGIAQINSWGGTTKTFDVSVDLRRLQAWHLSIAQVLTALGNANINVGGREITLGQQSVNIRGIGLINDGGDDDLTQGTRLDDIENVVITQNHGIPVLVKDVARVSIGYLPRLGIAGRDRQDDIVAAIVVMSRTQHTNAMIAKIKKMVHTMNHDGSLPAGVHIVPYYDRSQLVAVTTHTVLHNLLFGCLLVFIIQWLFLGDLRSALIVGFNIPIALLCSTLMLYWRGEDANLLSIGAVDFGIIVDSAVILVENVFRNLQKPIAAQEDLRHADQAEDGLVGRPKKPWSLRRSIIMISGHQVGRAVFFSTLITVAAFMPLFTMQGVEGQIFGPMARTYAYALIGALISTFTFTPVLSAWMMPAQITEVETFLVRYLRHIYDFVLDHALRHRVWIVTLATLFLLVCTWLVPRLGSEFLPSLEEGNFWIRAAMPPTLSLADGTRATRTMRDILLRHPEVITVVSQHGRPDNGSDASPLSNVELFVPLKPQAEWPHGETKAKLTETLQNEFKQALPGINFNFSQYIQDNIEEALSGVKGANSVKIIGPNLSELERLASEVQSAMQGVAGITDLGIFHLLGQTNLDIRIDRARAARYGLNSGDVNNVIQAALGGANATTVLEGDRQFGLLVRIRSDERDSLQKIRNLPVAWTDANGTTRYTPLSSIADIRLDEGAAYIYHEGTQRYIPVKFSVRGRDLGSSVSEAQQRIAQRVHLPAGYRIVWAGEFEDLQKARQRLEIMVPISFGLILALLYAMFNSVRDSLLALAGIPLAAAGGVLALYVTHLPFSISAAIGFISLSGVSVMNGILVLSYYNQLHGDGMEARAALRQAASQRMRPMLMTALSACIGLAPAAASHGIGSQVQRPLATVVVGGLALGAMLMLIVLPPLLSLLQPSARHGQDTGESA